ncbi:hypothetical protein ACFOY8_13130 [Thalassospira xianhensis]|uniref:Uncharacterized protein n=1 Tax=Thalassospira xianhensis MCCC 1A02616 TaxID=1177929 RepID=A0A367UIJ1_9PROT|nr:hypothetical protein [Thalassospira xianhensis]RCK07850.1 hypothetical protein TH5_02160 [Thalassospira xianhensis MCCC 1A02616]
MHCLLPAVLAIAFVAGILAAGMNYVSPTAFARSEMRVILATGFSALSQGIAAYKVAIRDVPIAKPDGTLPNDLISGYVTAPRNLDGMAWSYGTQPRTWVCSFGSVTENQWKGIVAFLEGDSTGRVGMSTSSCADFNPDGSPKTSPETPVTFPTTVFVNFAI